MATCVIACVYLSCVANAWLYLTKQNGIQKLCCSKLIPVTCSHTFYKQ